MFTKTKCNECGTPIEQDSGHYYFIENALKPHKKTCSKYEPKGGYIL